MIPVTVENVSFSNFGFVVLLKSQQDERSLPIFIGIPEAQAMIIHLSGVNPPRPMTHDLLKNVLDALEARLDRIEVRELKDGTFFGKLVLSFEGQTLEVDSRPSDAIAVALRCHVPILVAEHVMAEAGVVLGQDKQEEKEELPRPDDPVTKLKGELAYAISEERYEDAARIRDEIKRVSNAN